MWKKFLAATAVVAMLLSSTSAFAISGGTIVDDGGNTGSQANVMTNAKATPSTIAPGVGETTTVSFDLSVDAVVTAKVKASDTSDVVTLATAKSEKAGTVSYVWNGKDSTGKNVVDGKYSVEIDADDATGGPLGFGVVEVTVVTKINGVDKAPKVFSLKASPSSFVPSNVEDTEISFDVDKDGYVTVEIKDGTKVVKTFESYNGAVWYDNTESHSIQWDGLDNSDNVVAAGKYQIWVTTKNNDGSNVNFSEVEVATASVYSDGDIQDLVIDPKSNWDPTDQDLEIEFELVSDVKTLRITAKKGNKVVEILDDNYADDDDYMEVWDGTDDDGDYVDQGVWTITVRADGSVVSRDINVVYETPNLVSAFVTKDSFDPQEDESTNLVFKVDESAVITVDVYQGSKKEVTIWDNVSVKKNRWYVVEWNGTDRDGDRVLYGKDWKFRITSENATEKKSKDATIVEIDVEQDDVTYKKANVTNDGTAPVVFDKNYSSTVALSYYIDADADVYVAVYDGKSTSGKEEIELLDYVSQDAGWNTIEWNGRDKYGKALSNGLYTVKIISKANGSNKDTEIVRFVVGDAGNFTFVPEDDEEDDYEWPVEEEEEEDVVVPACEYYYWDVAKTDAATCEAIAWASEMKVFTGNPDGSFRPYSAINRAEVLKTVLEAYNAGLIPNDGTAQGFSDVDAYAWYMPYVRTAKVFGILNGYGDGTARLNNNVNRVEFLKFVLQASTAFTGGTPVASYNGYYDVNAGDVSTAWYMSYANVAYQYDLFEGSYLNAGQAVTRGEVALILYKMSNAGLL